MPELYGHQVAHAQQRHHRGISANSERVLLAAAILVRPLRFDPKTPPRKRRQLRMTAPEIHPFRAGDGTELLEKNEPLRFVSNISSHSSLLTLSISGVQPVSAGLLTSTFNPSVI
jgi:hypothetical protein